MSSHSPFESNDLIKLIDKARDGDSECTSRLNEILRNDPSAAQLYLEYSAMQADLRGAVKLSRVRGNVERTIENASPSHRTRRLRSISWAVSFAMAAAIGFALFSLSQLPEGNESANELVAGAESWPHAVATLNRVENVTWSPQSPVSRQGSQLKLDTRLQLDEGLVEIEFLRGALVVLEGPAEIVLTGENQALLVSGALAADVPSWAKGFRVNTPGVDVIDHGTRFIMSVGSEQNGAEVKVVVAEGEVELVQPNHEADGKRLFAGEGARVDQTSIQAQSADEAADRLAAKLPSKIGDRDVIVVGDRWRDWQPGEPDQPNRNGPWRYLANLDGPFGEPNSYVEMRWCGEINKLRPCFKPNGIAKNNPPSPLGPVRVHRDGGHPGAGRSQAKDGLDHYSITAFVVPEDGRYSIESGWLERPEPKRWDLDHVLDIAVHVNEGPVLFREFCHRDCYVRFRGEIGELAAGDLVYVGVGPSGVNYNDRFRWGFYIVRELEQENGTERVRNNSAEDEDA